MGAQRVMERNGLGRSELSSASEKEHNNNNNNNNSISSGATLLRNAF